MRFTNTLILVLLSVGCSANGGKKWNGRASGASPQDGDLQDRQVGHIEPFGQDNPDGNAHPADSAGAPPVTIMGTNLCSTVDRGSVSYVATAPKGFSITGLKTQLSVAGSSAVVTNKGSTGRLFHPGDAAMKVVVTLKDASGKLSDLVIAPQNKASPNIAALAFENSGIALGKMHIIQVSNVDNKMTDVGSILVDRIRAGVDSYLFSFAKGQEVAYTAVTMQNQRDPNVVGSDLASDLIGLRWTKNGGFGQQVLLDTNRGLSFVAASDNGSSIITATSNSPHGATPSSPVSISLQVAKFDADSLGGKAILRDFPYREVDSSSVEGNLTGLGTPDGSYFTLNLTHTGSTSGESSFVRSWVLASNTEIATVSEVDVGYDYVTKTGGNMSGTSVARDGFVYSVGVVSIDTAPTYGSTVQIVRTSSNGERKVVAERHFQSYMGTIPRLLGAWTAAGAEPDLSLIWFAQNPSMGASASIYRIHSGQFDEGVQLDPALNVEELRGGCQIAAGVDGLNRPNLLYLRQGLFHYGDPNMGRSALIHVVVSKTAGGYTVQRKEIPVSAFTQLLRCLSNNLALGEDSPFDFAPQSTDPRN